MVPGKLSLLIVLHILIISFSSASPSDDLSPSADDAILSLEGTVYLDQDGDRFLSENEIGLANVTVQLMQDGLLQASALTGGEGHYIFPNLSPGIYSLEAGPVAGNSQTAPGRGYYEVKLTDLAGSGLDFGFVSFSRPLAALTLEAHPLMHPVPEEVALWTSQYSASPKAVVIPETAALLAAAPPKSFSLLDQLKYNASERDQGTCGNCWAWAGTGVMEIDYARQMKKSDRFSVQFLDSNYNGGCGSNAACCGGWLDNLAGFYKVKKIIVPWSNANAHYQDGSRSCGGCSAVPAYKISTSPRYEVASISTSRIATQGLPSDQAIANIKGVLLQGKAIWFGFFLPDAASWSNFQDFWGSKPETALWQPDYACGRTYSYQSGGGHAVLCLGYNDTDPKNRYWIMLNSWGDTPARPSGLFRVAMDMNYNCSYTGLGYAFYWMTLDMSYDAGQNSPPQTPAPVQGLTQGYVGKILSFTAAAKDPEGDQLFFTFDWGDGTTTKTLLSASSTGKANHIWKDKGVYKVKAMATDSSGVSSGWSEPFAVSISGSSTVNSPPKKPSTPAGIYSGLAGISYAFTAYAADPNRDPISYAFDWGDGQTTTTDFRTSGLSARASHAWPLAGAYSVRVQATDGSGAQSPWSAAKTVTIKKAAGQRASKILEKAYGKVSASKADLAMVKKRII
jgi:hypothetical protein